jgi:hypothetical protein
MTSAAADPSYIVVKNWSNGPMAVEQQKMADGRQVCHFEQPGEQSVFGLSQTQQGIMGATLAIDDKWPHGGNVTMTIDGGASFTGSAEVFNDGHSLWVPIPNEDAGRDFLRAFYNGARLTVAADAVRASFSLTGSATAITVLHRCGDQIAFELAHPTPPSDQAPFTRDWSQPTAPVEVFEVHHPDEGRQFCRAKISATAPDNDLLHSASFFLEPLGKNRYSAELSQASVDPDETEITINVDGRVWTLHAHPTYPFNATDLNFYLPSRLVRAIEIEGKIMTITVGKTAFSFSLGGVDTGIKLLNLCADALEAP